jgi:hypothetical protein
VTRDALMQEAERCRLAMDRIESNLAAHKARIEALAQEVGRIRETLLAEGEDVPALRHGGGE